METQWGSRPHTLPTFRPMSIVAKRSPISAIADLLLIFGRPFLKRLALICWTTLLSVCSLCDAGVLWPNDWMHQDETWHGGRPRPMPHCVRWQPSARPKKGTQPPNFWPMSVVSKRLDGRPAHVVQWSNHLGAMCSRA